MNNSDDHKHMSDVIISSSYVKTFTFFNNYVDKGVLLLM